MSDNEYERFEITDYDLDNEFNINRPRRKQTKNQQIYGIWANNSDDDSAEETSRHRGRRGRSKPKDYSAPVNFVAGGIHQIGKKDKLKSLEGDKDVVDDQITVEEDDEEDERPSFGRKQPELKARSSTDTSEESSADERKAQSSRAGFAHKSHIPSTKNVGIWEQHTRGIGAKLLLQMGYKPGMGLGKDLQGISQPVEAHVRKGRGAIGAYGPEKAASVPGRDTKPKEDEDVREAKEFKEKLNKWKKSGESQSEKQKRYYYKSVEEVIERGKKSNTLLSEKLRKKLGNVPVIDMTGPEKRVLSGYHSLGQSRVQDEDLYELKDVTSAATKKKPTTTSFALPELLHNLQLIVNMCEQDIIALDKTEHEACERQAALEHECKHLQEIANLESNHITTLEKALKLVEELTESDADQLSLERAEQIFVTLQQDFAPEYKEYALGDLAAGIIAPLVKRKLDQWKPLEQPTQCIDTIKKWRSILYDESIDATSETRNVFDPYSSLIWAGVVPSFRVCSADWDPKKHQQMAALLDSWAPLFPTWILDSVLEQLVLPRLCAGVSEWDPLTDAVPIHIWILPWNVILGHKMEEFIFPTIREKLGAALQSWLPHDRSACAMLKPWKGIFDDTEMQIFLSQHIIPKLQLVLNTFIISPIHQDLEPWNQVMEWQEIIPTMLMGNLLDKFFFPKWMQVLVIWLNQSPDYAEISRWYTGWKTMLSEDLLREPNIKEHLRRALEIMQRATDNILGNNTGASIPQTQQLPPPPPPPAPPSLMDLQIPTPVQLEFKELVLQKCAERGILFAPMPGRREMGKQVYRVGKLFCYIDRNVCMISENSFTNWTPISVQQLLDRATAGVI